MAAGGKKSGKAEALPPALIGIVGVGASAGSASSLERLFAHAPRDAGLAYVVALKTEDGLSPERVLGATT